MIYMQGINKTQHGHLIAALTQLQQLLAQNGEVKAMQQAAIYQEELESMMAGYERLLAELLTQIIAYREQYDEAKIKFLSVKLKELKKVIPQESLVFFLLKQNIQQAYGT
ncbi:hypothetical protein BDD43_3598 [Mucilaginibacter gracilis]|uniref:Uncharacterized protein n=1 Tax=Mucilaginibacter gracilis TaxID=423350 RepID=A0A495J349_9SPHI|nr:hypothetical protein [Mucilaginibacter gracilis]RKR83390.1 hypothetical protein BDD43_3598 [Mucilaginibacter gracilis]